MNSSKSHWLPQIDSSGPEGSMTIWDEMNAMNFVIGPVETDRGEESADLAIFLDGDINNFESGNVLDIDFFENSYTFDQFLEDFEDRCYYMDRAMLLQEALDDIEAGAEVKSRLERLQRDLRRCTKRRCDGHEEPV